MKIDPEVFAAVTGGIDDLSFIIEIRRLCHTKMDELSREDLFYMLGTLCGRLLNHTVDEGEKT